MHRVPLEFALPLLVAAFASACAERTAPPDAPAASARVARVAGPPLHFEPAAGRLGEEQGFLARAPGASVFVTSERTVVATAEGAVVTMRFEGARPGALVPRAPLPGRVNVYVGAPAERRLGLRTFGELVREDVHPGIDAVFHGDPHALEFDFVVAPGADAGGLVMAYEGVERVAVDPQGDLVLSTAQGDLRQLRPVAWQETGSGRREVAVAYRPLGERRVGLRIGPHDPARELVVDPVLVYSTHLGGSFADTAEGVAAAADGAVYVVGSTTSPNFLGRSGLRPFDPLPQDAYVAKIAASGDRLLWLTFLGGRENPGLRGPGTTGRAVALGPGGDPYVTGHTRTLDFPTTAGAFQEEAPGAERDTGGRVVDVNEDGFVARLDPETGAIVWATYLGGVGATPEEVNADDLATGIAVDAQGRPYVTGQTLSTAFPTAGDAFQFFDPDALIQGGAIFGNRQDVFVAALSPAGTSLFAGTYLGGANDDGGPEGRLPGGLQSIDLDQDGEVYVAGRTQSADFPVSVDAVSTVLGGGYDGFLARLSPTLEVLRYSTYLGGLQDEGTTPLSRFGVDALGDLTAYVAGETRSEDFPVTLLAFDTTHGGPGTMDGFVARIDTQPDALEDPLLWSTFLGGAGDDGTTAVRARGASVHVAGWTESTDFPVADPIQRFGQGGEEAFLAELAPAAEPALQLVFSTYFGGFRSDAATGLALGDPDDAFVVGTSNSTSRFPYVNALQPRYVGGTSEAFLAKVSAEAEPSGHDFAVTRVRAPKRVKLNSRRPSRNQVVGVQIQNRGTHTETIADLAQLDALVDLQVLSLGDCPDPPAVLRARQARKLPRTLRPGDRFTVYFDVLFDCANDPERNRRRRGEAGHEDFRYAASVHHEAFSGLADDHPADDVCPRDPAGPEPFPGGPRNDAGCAEQRTDVWIRSPLGF